MKRTAVLCCLLACCLLLLPSCAEGEPTHIVFSISAEEMHEGGTVLPAVEHVITLPRTALEEQTVMAAIVYACDALGYPYLREGKYSEILVSVAGRANTADKAWKIEAIDTKGNARPVTTDDGMENIVRLSVTYSVS